MKRAPAIPPLPEEQPRPRWSVMIPVRDRATYLEQCLRSILVQDGGPNEMQIEVVDNSTRETGIEALVRRVSGDRIVYFRQEADLTMSQNWNSCIERACGHLVHILHDDDWVGRGFYDSVAQAVAEYPNLAVYAVRCFFVTEDGVIEKVSPRMRALEFPTNDLSAFSFETPYQCVGMVVKRDFYSVHGGFRPDLIYAPDWEMWARAFARGSGVALPHPNAYYRIHKQAESGVLAETGENLRDLIRMAEYVAAEGNNFDASSLQRRIAWQALCQHDLFLTAGEVDSAAINLRMFNELAPLSTRAVRSIRIAMTHIRGLSGRWRRMRICRDVAE